MKIRNLDSRVLTSIALLLLSSMYIFAGNPSSVCYNLDNCDSDIYDGTNQIYSEFGPAISNTDGCGFFTASTLFRQNPSDNTHSCTPGPNGTPAMCITSYIGCIFYEPAYEAALRFEVTLNPNGEASSTLGSIEFFEKAPERFEYIDGASGPNNYPTLYAVRVLVNGNEIYRQEEIPTTTDWTLETIDFSSNPAFTVSSATTFEFQIAPYCIVGNGNATTAWDIDELKIYSACGNDVDPGVITTSEGQTTVDICEAFSTGSFDVNVVDGSGTNHFWVVTDNSGIILALPAGPPFNLSYLGNGTCNLYLVSYNGTIGGFAPGNQLFGSATTGCFAISNAIRVIKDGPDGGTISSNGNTSLDINICDSDGTNTTVDVSLLGGSGNTNNFIVTDGTGNIVLITTGPTIDFGLLGAGNYTIWNISYTTQLSNFFVGNNISDVIGCYGLSNPISVGRSDVYAGEVTTTQGGISFTFCTTDGIADVINGVVMNPSGMGFQWIITDSNGNILELPADGNFTFDGVPSGTCYIYHLAFRTGFMGANVGSNISDFTGCFDLSNRIEVVRNEEQAGVISSPQGDEIRLCTSDDQADIVDATMTGALGTNSTWLVTDQKGIITFIQDSPPFDFSGSDAGICLIWHLNYSAGMFGMGVGEDINDMRGCLGLSNSITVIKQAAEAGTISSPQGSVIDICIDNHGGGSGTGSGSGAEVMNGIVDAVLDDSGIGKKTETQWVIYDENGIILDLPAGPPFDFSSAGSGTCFIAHYAYDTTNPGLQMGADIDNLNGCFDSSNVITVNRNEVDAGQIIGTNNQSTINLCFTGSNQPLVNVSFTVNPSENGFWVITDTNDVILEVASGPPFNFAGADIGTCRIYHVVADEGTTGLFAGGDLSSLRGCFDVSNAVTVIRNQVAPSAITSNGATSVNICSSETNLTIPVTNTGGAGVTGLYVITNVNGTIIETQSGSPIDFSGFNNGNYSIYFVDFISVETVFIAGLNINSLVGCFALSNPIAVNINSVDGGSISTPSPLDICVGNGEDDIVNVTLTGPVGANFTYVITDTNGNIIDLSTVGQFNFDDAGIGTCLIWHLSFEDGLIGLTVGSSVNNLIGCHDFSNPLTVVRNEANAGTLTTSLGDNVEVCLGDGVDENLNVILSNPVGDNFQWLITDSAGNILDLPTGPPFNFENTGGGVCLIWHLSFSNGLTGLNVGANTSNFQGCFDLSNPITVTRTDVNGGIISTSDPLDVCVGDGVADQVNLSITGTQGPNNSWVITDTNGNIIDLPASSPFNFEDAGVGVCLIWNVSFVTGLTGLTVGANVSNLNGCFDLSNSISVTRNQVIPSVISSSLGDLIQICLSDATADIVDVSISGGQAGNNMWIIVDESGTVVSLPSSPPFDFTNFPDGICRIFNVSFSSSFGGITTGNNINNLTGCFALSNPITVRKNSVEGGTINTNDPTSVCVGDGQADLVNVTLTGNVGPTSLWIITDENGNILSLPSAPPFDFDDAGIGACTIRNISYAGSIEGLLIGANVSNITGCFDLSNFITIERNQVSGGNISSPLGDNISICGSSTVEVNLANAAGDNQIWIITDSNNNIVQNATNSPLSFDSLPIGTYNIYNLSYGTGTSGFQVGSNLSSISGCSALSNSITVSKDEVEGGMTSLGNGATELLICGEVEERFTLVNVTGNIGDNSLWVLVNSSGVISDVQNTGSFELVLDVQEICNIYHIAFNGTLVGGTVGSNISDLQGCYDLSTPLVVNKIDNIAGAAVFTDGTLSMSICSGNGQSNIINATVSGNSGGFQGWLIADTNGNIIDTPASMPYDFEGLTSSECLVYHITYESGLSGYVPGGTLIGLSGCFHLSNALTVTKQVVDGGSLVGENGGVTENICLQTGEDNSINFGLSGNLGPFSQYVVTDVSGVILELPASSNIDFSDYTVGTCMVLHLSFHAGLVGAEVGLNVSGLSGCFDLSNPVTVNKFGNLNPTITGPDGDSYSYCTNDGTPNILTVTLDDSACSFGNFVLLDDDGIVIRIYDEPTFDFTGFPTEDCTLYYVCYELEENGLTAGWPLDAIIGCYSLSNPISIEKINVNGGMLTTKDGDTEIVACNGGEQTENISVILNGNQGRDIWVITDLACNVISIPPGPTFDFSNITGTCQLWNLSFDGSIGDVQTGDNIKSDIIGCYGLSNPLTVFKGDTDAGVITIEGSVGKSEIDFCSGDGIDDIVDINVSGAVTGSGTLNFVITDPDGKIVDVSSPPYNFEGSQTGSCFIYNVHSLPGFSGLIEGNDIDEDLVGCFDISNPIIVNKCYVDAGAITFANGSTAVDICSGDGIDDIININVIGETGRNCSFIVTSPAGEILAVNDDPTFNLEGVPNEHCHIYSLCYKEEDFEFLAVGFNVSKFMGCFDFSNRLTVTKCFVDGGTLTTASGATEVNICAGDGIPDFLSLFAVDGSGTTDVIITDPMGTIAIPADPSTYDFDGISGTCQIWQVAYKTLPTGLVDGGNTSNISGCFALSNPINVIKDEVEVCNLSFALGGTQAIVCQGDALSDVIEFESDCDNDNNFQYFITDTDGIILDLAIDSTYDFSASSIGTCRVYGLDYTGTLIPSMDLIGEDLDTISVFTNACAQLSGNFLEVEKTTDVGQCSTIAPTEGPIVSTVYPNPANDYINVNISQFPELTGSIHIIDIIGRIMMSIPINNEQSLYRINIRDLTQGNYLLKIGSTRDSEIHRFNKIVK